MEYRITKENKWKRVRRMYIGGVVWLLLIVIGLSIPGGWIGVLCAIFPLAFIDLVPAIYLFKEYIHFNKDSTIEINTEEKKIIFFTAGNVIESTFMDIKQINGYLTPNKYRTDLEAFSSGGFLYARFELKDGREFYVTSLMIPKFKKVFADSFRDIPIIVHLWFIPSIRLCDYFRRSNKPVST